MFKTVAEHYLPVIVLLATTTSFAHADECRDILIPNHIEYSSDRSVQLSWLRTITNQEELDKAHNASAGASILVDGLPFSGYGNYSDFSSARTRTYSQEAFNLNDAQSQRLVVSALGPAETTKWAECMARNGTSIVAYPKNITATNITAYISFPASPLITTPISLNINPPSGGQLHSGYQYPTSIPPRGEISLLFDRDPSSPDFLFIVNAGGGMLTQSFLVPGISHAPVTSCEKSFDTMSNIGNPATVQSCQLAKNAAVHVEITGAANCSGASTNVLEASITSTDGAVKHIAQVREGTIEGDAIGGSFNDHPDENGYVSIVFMDIHCNETPHPAQEYPMVWKGKMVVTVQ